MFPILVTLFLSAALGASPARNSARIVNGQIAPPGEFPYQVSLRHGGMHFCGGSIINQNTILTAAHCVSLRTPDQITVVAGTTRSDDDSGDFYNVSRIINHENWTESNALNDIALLKLSKSITFNDLVGIISVASEDVAPNTDAIVSGWGLTHPNGQNSPDLLYIYLKIINYLECRKAQPATGTMPIESSHICGLNQDGKGVCSQDSGGPMVTNGKQLGIVSWGAKCAAGYADVYTKVSFYKNWIDSHI